jgi:hypothetical protein
LRHDLREWQLSRIQTTVRCGATTRPDRTGLKVVYCSPKVSSVNVEEDAPARLRVEEARPLDPRTVAFPLRSICRFQKKVYAV